MVKKLRYLDFHYSKTALPGAIKKLRYLEFFTPKTALPGLSSGPGSALSIVLTSMSLLSLFSSCL